MQVRKFIKQIGSNFAQGAGTMVQPSTPQCIMMLVTGFQSRCLAIRHNFPHST